MRLSADRTQTFGEFFQLFRGDAVTFEKNKAERPSLFKKGYFLFGQNRSAASQNNGAMRCPIRVEQ